MRLRRSMWAATAAQTDSVTIGMLSFKHLNVYQIKRNKKENNYCTPSPNNVTSATRMQCTKNNVSSLQSNLTTHSRSRSGLALGRELRRSRTRRRQNTVESELLGHARCTVPCSSTIFVQTTLIRLGC